MRYVIEFFTCSIDSDRILFEIQSGPGDLCLFNLSTISVIISLYVMEKYVTFLPHLIMHTSSAAPSFFESGSSQRSSMKHGGASS